MNQEIIYKTYTHIPPHLFVPNTKYFITASTYQKKYYLKEQAAKEILLNSIIKGFKDFNWQIDDWVILNNHYHLMVQSPGDSSTLPKIIQNIHKFSALKLKKEIIFMKNAGKVWYNFWDTCITFEKSYFARINYIWYNPIKHRVSKDPSHWKFGSYYYRLNQDDSSIEQIKEKYPFNKVKIFDDF